MILILSDRFDIHADVVEQHLIHQGADFFRLNLDILSLQESYITFDGKIWTIRYRQRNFQSNQASCVWLRRAFVEQPFDIETSDVDFHIWKGEWNKTLLGFYSSIYHIPWMNPLRENSRAENKYYQMSIAQEAGFLAPETITSNDKDVLLDFCHKHDEVVLKLMNQDFYRTDNGQFMGIYVNKVSVDALAQFGDSSENPVVLQRYIPKSFEVRYTIVGESHLACRIESQKSSIANIDWRRYDIPNTPHYKIDPPEDIKQKCRKVMQKLNLVYGAIDFVVTPEGGWYFLEINPSGQWMWIEDLTGLPISRRIAEWLVNHSKKQT